MALINYKLGELITQSDFRNSDESLSVDDVRGISTGKEFIETKANMDGVSVSSYKVVNEDEFAYVADTSRRGEKIALAYNSNEGKIIISSIYTVFFVSRKDLLLSDYLFMYFNRPEFDRYSRFNSWVLQEKHFLGMICVIWILNSHPLKFSRNMLMSTMQCCQINRAMKVD